MENILQIIVPIITLVIGYFLNVLVGLIESNREIKRRRVTEKEKAYSEIIGKLHELFEEHRINTLRETSTIAGHSQFGETDETVIIQKYNELEKLVYKYSLYLKPHLIESLVNLKLVDFRESVNPILHSIDNNIVDKIEFLEQHEDKIWKKA